MEILGDVSRQTRKEGKEKAREGENEGKKKTTFGIGQIVTKKKNLFTCN